jgi:hypothetical protein
MKLAFFGLALLIAASPVLADGAYGKQKVVYHVNSGDDRTLNIAILNVENHLSAVGPDKIDLVVVTHGNGVRLLERATESIELQARIRDLKKQGVTLRVCENTLKNKNIDYERDLFEVSRQDLVPSGVAELARLQQQGYVYVKP